MGHEQDRRLVSLEHRPEAARIAPDDREAALAPSRRRDRRRGRRRPRSVHLERPAFEATVVRIVEVGDDQPLHLSPPEGDLGRLPHALEAARDTEIDPLADELVAQALRLGDTGRRQGAADCNVSVDAVPDAELALAVPCDDQAFHERKATCARVTSAGELQPNNMSPRATSFCSRSRTARTPSSPAAARPQIGARPTSTARAPRASERRTSTPRRTPPSSSTSTRPSTASATSGSASIDAATPSSWRPPWFETTTAAAPCSTASRASSAVSTPLSTTGKPCPASHSRSRQVTLALKSLKMSPAISKSSGTWKPTRSAPSRRPRIGVSTVSTRAA